MILKSFVILYINSAECALQDLLLGKIEPPILFTNIVSEIKGETFCPFQDFQGLQPKFKDFNRAWNFHLPIPGLSKNFKDRGNPEQSMSMPGKQLVNTCELHCTRTLNTWHHWTS